MSVAINENLEVLHASEAKSFERYRFSLIFLAPRIQACSFPPLTP
jgi:hypothetical protein